MLKTEGAEENIEAMHARYSRILHSSLTKFDLRTGHFQQHVELEHRRTWIEQQNEWWRTDHKEQRRYCRAKVYWEQVYSNPVHGLYCVYKEHVVISPKLYSLGYYNRFYLYTLVLAEIGEFFDQDLSFSRRLNYSILFIAGSKWRHFCLVCSVYRYTNNNILQDVIFVDIIKEVHRGWSYCERYFDRK